MSSPAFRRLFSQASRMGCRRSAASSARGFGARRGMASDAHGSAAKASSDTPWLLASGTVTVLGIAWILTPPSKKHAHAAAKAAMAPIEDSFPPPEKPGKQAEPMTDDEGTEASAAEIGDSIDKAIDANAPKAAKAAEEKVEEATPEAEVEEPTRSDDDTPKEEAGDEKPEVKQKPTERSGTFQGEGESGPTDLGVARASAKNKNAPKEASGASD
ncbi:hypothetical protein M0805_008594 [Coniferiporia weirii]|nr:hypothetical protein M0805_008594 [Coniferiporia weirii]